MVLGRAVEADPEVIAAVQVYVDEVNTARSSYRVLFEHTEVTLECLTVEDMGGTSDHFMVYVDDGRIYLHVFDYKHGVGVPVSVQDNKQLLSYFLIIESHYPGMFDGFRGTIVQPRAFSGDAVQTWECTPERVQEHHAAILQAASQTHLSAGEHCRWCPALTICPELRAHSLRMAQEEFAEIKDDAQKLVELLELKPAITALLDAIPGALLEHFRAGNGVPGYKVVEGQGNRAWKWGDADTVLRNLKRLGVGKRQAIEEKLKSPPAIEKELPKDKHKLLEELVTRPSTGYRVVRESAKGKPVDFSVSEFTEITE